MDTLERPAKEIEAEKLVNSYMGWSAGAGLVPVPGLDLAAIAGVQIKMLDDLSKLYNVPFTKNVAKAIIGALVGSSGSLLLSAPAASLMKFVPIVGNIAALFVEPAASAAATYALGKVFIQHFESGGTFLDFNPSAVRKYYDEQYAAAKGGAARSTATPKPA